MYTIKNGLSLTLMLILFVSSSFNIVGKDDIIDYYNIPPELSFNKINYKLCWSSHPNDTYYKQEYIPQGEVVEHFNDMILIDFLNTDIPVKDAVQAQVANLIERKKTDMVCNYQLGINDKTNEYILDFVMSDVSNDHVHIVEWNGYRYKPYTDKSGHKGVLLFGVSHRAYDDKGTDFLRSLGSYRHEILQKLSMHSIPEIQLK